MSLVGTLLGCGHFLLSLGHPEQFTPVMVATRGRDVLWAFQHSSPGLQWWWWERLLSALFT